MIKKSFLIGVTCTVVALIVIYVVFHPEDTDPFTEMECTVGTGEWILPATLTTPRGEGPFPAIVLVHGSGPNDRDETVGPNKPFKDLAWGLATRGVAVLRYEKRTRQYGAKIVENLENFTVKEEVIDDALAAVDLLRRTEGIDNKKIFVLGHSLGGTLAPRIASHDEEIAGIILLAGTPRYLLDLWLEQSIYLASLDNEIDNAEAEYIEMIEEAIEEVNDPGVDNSEIILGASKTYWLDLKAYDPIETAKNLTIPMLILQGGRDYNVTLEDFNGWKDGLDGRDNVTFKLYENLNHLFIFGSGVPSPDEYWIAGNVAQIVIEDIAEWVKSQ